METNIYNDYAALDTQIKALTEQKEQMRTAILEDMEKRGMDKEEHEMGSFSITKLKKWEYPAKVVALGEKFKVAKAKAESTGEATYEESNSLRFTAVKL